MANFGTMAQRIKDEILRDTSVDATYAKKAIVSAIDFYKYHRFWFNESNFLLSTVDGTNGYSPVSSGTAGYPRDLISIDHLSLLDGSTITTINKVGIQEFRERRTSTTTEGKPLYWAFHGELLLLYPTPDAVYTVTGHSVRELAVDDPGTGTVYAPSILPIYEGGVWVFEDADGNALTDACTSAWFVEGEQLIRAKAKSIVYKEVLKDAKSADVEERAAGLAFINLKGATDRFEMPDRTVPWY
jgi:hypothetical protein